MIEVIIAIISAVSLIGAALLTWANTRRSNDLKKIELDQAMLAANQEEEARKRKEASEKHATDMQRVAALEERGQTLSSEMDRMRVKYAVLWAYVIDLMTHISEGKPPPPPPIPSALLE